MSGDSNYPGGIDTAYGTEAAYRSGAWNNIDGSSDDFAAWMRRVESGMIGLETYGARVLGDVGGVAAISNSTTETSLLASAITIPANLLRTGSAVRVQAVGYVIINSNTATTFQLKTYLGSTSLYSPNPFPTSGAWVLSASAHLWRIELVITADTVGASASITAGGQIAVTQPTSFAFDSTLGSQWRVEGYGGATVDTTSSLALQVKGTMSVANAANAMACQRCVAYVVPFVG